MRRSGLVVALFASRALALTLAFTLALTLLEATAQAQSLSPASSPTPLSGGGQPVWRCELPGGIYEVAVDSIVAVSSHEYLVDAAARVTEVNVDTTGTMTVRFYHLEPATPTSPLGLGQSTLNKVHELAHEAAERTGQGDLWRKVVKNYPATTHARTVEYRVESKEQLQKIFESAETAFRFRRNTTLKVP